MSHSPVATPSHAAERAARRRESLAAFVKEHEEAVTTSVPGVVRILALVGESHRQEIAKIRTQFATLPAERSRRVALVNKAYRNLVTDCKMRISGLKHHEPAKLFSIVGEAIGCFASMLPWSDSVLTVEVSTPLVAAAPAPLRSPASRRPPKRAGSSHHQAAARFVAAPPPVPSPSDAMLSFPSRLSFDTRKHAGIQANRRRTIARLQPAAVAAVVAAAVVAATPPSSPLIMAAPPARRETNATVSVAA